MAYCNTCEKPVKTDDKFIICSKCDKDYHHRCVNIDAETYLELKQIGISKWKCPKCTPPKKHRRGKRSAKKVENTSNISEATNGTKASNGKDKMVDTIREEIQNTLRLEVRNMIKFGFSDIKSQVDELKISRSSNDLDILKPHINNSKTELNGV